MLAPQLAPKCGVALVGAAAIPCAKIQRPREDRIQSLEHEALAGCVIAAMRDAGLPKESVGALVFTHPRPCTQQRYFDTFMANQLRLPTDGVLMEVLEYDDGPLFAARMAK